MAQKKTKKPAQQQKLSPEKYIQTKARHLSIHECFVNEGWDSTRMANVVIARKHTTGNLTIALYLVDLLCLGVTDTHYEFNISPDEYTQFIDHAFNEQSIQKIDYDLAHNIIKSAVTFAANFGFEPTKDFTKITQYVLKDDSEPIQTFTVECGDNNLPVVIETPYNHQEIQTIRAKLDATIGSDKYIYINQSDDYDEMEDLDEDEEYDELLDPQDYIYQNPLKERHEDIMVFRELAALKEEDQTDESITELLYICKKLIYNEHNLEELTQQQERFERFLDVTIDDEVLPFDLTQTKDIEHLNQIEEILDAVLDGDELKPFKINKLAQRHPEIPFYSLMRVVELSNGDNNTKKIIKTIDELLTIYPNYLLLNLENDLQLVLQNKKTTTITPQLLESGLLSDLFDGRKTLHLFEFLTTYGVISEYLIAKNELAKLDLFINTCKMMYPELQDFVANKEFISVILNLDYCKEKYFEK